MFKCPECSAKVELITSARNMHFTGDPKKFYLCKCPDCQDNFLFIDLDATLGSGSNYVLYSIAVSPEEALTLSNKMENCPREEDCKCEVHGFLDAFENKNRDRRETIVDEYEVW